MRGSGSTGTTACRASTTARPAPASTATTSTTPRGQCGCWRDCARGALDIASSLYFASLASAFVPVRYYEYRPVDLHLSGLTCDQADLLDLPFADRSVQASRACTSSSTSASGRYGDALDPDGDLKAMAELERGAAPGGDLLFVVPVGTPRVQFNATGSTASIR